MSDELNRNELIYIQLANLIRNEIAHGEKEKVASLRDLAYRFSVNYKTVNKAINILIEEGSLYRVRGKGTFVNRNKVNPIENLRIGFLIPNIINPYFAYLAHITESIAFKQNIIITVATTGDNSDKITTIMKEFKSQGINIIILHGGVLKTGVGLNVISKFGIPIVGMHCDLDTIDNVSPDLRRAAFLGTDYLISKYGSQIGYVSGSIDPIYETGRFFGYKEAFQHNNAQINNDFILQADPTFRGGYLSASQFIKRDVLPRAILFYNEIMAMGAISAFQEKGLQIPDEIAIMGIDYSIPTDQMLIPIPTVSLENLIVAQSTLDLCKRRVADPTAEQIRKKIAPLLIVR
jgi:DNA-binding LacI/PurR family transcriptional regulator